LINPSQQFSANRRDSALLPYVSALPQYTPREIHDRIRKSLYVGQDQAVRAVSLMAYRHVNRLRSLYLANTAKERLPQKANMLFVGPTGCGKTYLMEILFRELLKLPTVIVDMTVYSETGYVGQDVSSILTRLLYAADLNPIAASIGVICLDEFDKLASGQNNAVFAGAGTTKDVSGLGVQRELLKMLESSEVTIPVELSHSDYAPKAMISTGDIPFVACGAFSGLKGLIERREEHIGFGRGGLSGSQDKIAVSFTVDDVEMAKNFTNYGFLPELIGRFNRIVPFHALEEEQLAQILHQSILSRYTTEFSLQDIELVVSEEVTGKIVKESLAKETGARGLEAALIRFLEDASFEAYSTPGVRRVEIVLVDGEVSFRFE
jgi:ATP-dependent Clp protease ATP-binding subunit ClpX